MSDEMNDQKVLLAAVAFIHDKGLIYEAPELVSEWWEKLLRDQEADKERQKEAALAKLTDDEKTLLGLDHPKPAPAMEPLKLSSGSEIRKSRPIPRRSA